MAETTDKTADTARETGQAIGDEIREKGSEAAQAATDAVRTQAERARDEAYARGEHYRDYAAEETAKVASALRRASKDLSEGSPQERFLGQIADNIADAADRMRGMTLADTVRETGDFARRHPTAFLGGAALLGFAAARFLKASAHDETQLYLPPSNRTGAQSSAPHGTGAQSSAPHGAGAQSSAPHGAGAQTSGPQTSASQSPAAGGTASSPRTPPAAPAPGSRPQG